jgi:hypothetical protein
MKRFVTTGLVAVVALSLAAPAMAAEAKTKHAGVGFIIGEPTGLSAKFFMNNTNALQFGLAWSLSGANELHMQGDYTWHRYNLIDLKNGDEMPLYFGVGGRLIVAEGDKDNIFGIRFPVGFDYLFTNYPFDIFAEIVPILDLTPNSDFDLEGAIGARFWF